MTILKNISEFFISGEKKISWDKNKYLIQQKWTFYEHKQTNNLYAANFICVKAMEFK